MGVTTPTRLTDLGGRIWLVRAGWATLVANIVLVVTGGAVRLTGSGLGCPTWPRCHGGSFTPHGELNVHSAIEFGNRTLTFVLTAVAVLTLVVAWRSARRELRWMAVGLALSIPAQAVLGGITVLTHLNPWVVSLHLVFSLAIIGLAVAFLWRIDRPLPRPSLLGWLTFGATWAVLYAGTVVTGAGPHAGDIHARRNDLSPLQTSQFHADLVFLLVGLTLAMLVLARTRAVVWLFGLEIAQGVVGFVQYFTHLPIALVAVHMLGAALIAAAAAWVLLESGVPVVEQPAPPGELRSGSWAASPGQPLETAADRGAPRAAPRVLRSGHTRPTEPPGALLPNGRFPVP